MNSLYRYQNILHKKEISQLLVYKTYTYVIHGTINKNSTQANAYLRYGVEVWESEEGILLTGNELGGI